MITQHVRHGDVLLSPVDSIPSGLEPSKHDGTCVLAYGEVTFHSHKLSVKNPENLKVFQKGSNLFICLMEVGTLTHEEHATVEVPVGTYRRDMEREYDYALESMRAVID